MSLAGVVLAAVGAGIVPAAASTAAASGSQVTVCDYPHLVDAINNAAGGAVTFACSGTITVSPPITVSSGQQVWLDSTGQAIVLSGSSDRIFDVEGGTLKLGGASGGNLVLTGGTHLGTGGAIFIASGSTAELSYVTLQDSLAAGGDGGDASGGAIYNAGSLSVSYSLFSSNGAVGGTTATAARAATRPAGRSSMTAASRSVRRCRSPATTPTAAEAATARSARTAGMADSTHRLQLAAPDGGAIVVAQPSVGRSSTLAR